VQVADRFHLLRNLREALGTPPPVAPSTPSNPALTRSQQLSAEAETLRTLSASNQVIPARHLTPRRSFRLDIAQLRAIFVVPHRSTVGGPRLCLARRVR
jgi:hypothetical protein